MTPKADTTENDWPLDHARRIVERAHKATLARMDERREELRAMTTAELRAEHKRLKAELKRLRSLSPEELAEVRRQTHDRIRLEIATA